MSEFRCGVSDRQLALADSGMCRWPTKEVTYAVFGFIPDFTQPEYKAVIAAAFGRWMDVSGVLASEAKSGDVPNFVINAGRGRRSDFDGPGGVLAWCELPCGNPRQVKLFMDLDENWTEKLSGRRGEILVGNVLAHEIGHGLGLGHISSPRALMNPTYDPGVDRPLPPDVAEIVKRYGPKAATPPWPEPDPPTPPSPGPTPVPAPDGRKGRIELRVDGKVLFAAYAADLK